MDYRPILDNLSFYMGNGFLFLILLVCMMYLALSMKKSTEKSLLVWYPAMVLGVYFFPGWMVYFKYFSDGEILYRILWLVPVGVVIAFTMVEVIFKLPQKWRPFFFAAALMILFVSGKFLYANVNYSRAENIYHVPDTVVKLCDDIRVDGREIRVCVPDEFVNYVRQYSAYVSLPYGRGSLLENDYNRIDSEMQYVLSLDVVDTKRLVDTLHEYHCPYLFVKEGTEFDRPLSDFEFEYVKTIDGYDLYLDATVYIGIDYVNYT